MADTDTDIASQWQSFDPERRDRLIAKMSPEQKKKLRSALERGAAATAAPAEDNTPGYFKRLAQGVGLPSSRKELETLQPSTAEKLIGPPATAAKLGINYAKNLYGEGRKDLGEIQEASRNIGEGGPILPNLGKGYAAMSEFLLKGVLGPAGGNAVWAWGEDISRGNHTGAAGDATAVLVNALLLKGAAKPTENTRVNKLAFASDLPESMNAGKQLAVVLPDLDKATGKAGAPKTVGDLLGTIKTAKEGMNTESGLAMQPLRGKQYVPTPIADAIKRKITPDMTMTQEGRQLQSELMKAAKDYEKPWDYEQLDQARMRAGQRLRAYYKKGSTGQYADTKTDASVIVDKAIVNGVQDIVYPAMDKAAGKPAGYFANLKQRQGILIQLEEAVDDNIKALATRTAKIKGSPRFSQENVSAYGHPSSAPGFSIHKLQNIVKRPNPAARADAAVSRSFSGRPSAKGAIMSLPVRNLLMLPEPEPVKNRKEALDALNPATP